MWNFVPLLLGLFAVQPATVEQSVTRLIVQDEVILRVPVQAHPLFPEIEWVEKKTIRRALESARGIKKDAAELMGISQRALSYYLAKYRLD